MLERLRLFPYSENVFLMLKFRPHNKVLSDFITTTLEKHGLRGVRADQPEWNITNNLYNPLAVLYCCKYGLALFDEADDNQAYSPNVAYELGIMHIQSKECLILRHDSLPDVPFDLIKDLYELYGRDLDVREIVKRWASSIETRRKASDGVTFENQIGADNDSTEFLEEPEVVSGPGLVGFDAAYEVVQKNKSYWKFAWQIKVLNRSKGDLRPKLQIQFVNSKGFTVDDQVKAPEITLAPNQQRRFAEYNWVDAEIAPTIDQLKFIVTPR